MSDVRLMTEQEIAERQARATAAGYGKIDPERSWIIDIHDPAVKAASAVYSKWVHGKPFHELDDQTANNVMHEAQFILEAAAPNIAARALRNLAFKLERADEVADWNDLRDVADKYLEEA